MTSLRERLVTCRDRPAVRCISIQRDVMRHPDAQCRICGRTRDCWCDAITLKSPSSALQGRRTSAQFSFVRAVAADAARASQTGARHGGDDGQFYPGRSHGVSPRGAGSIPARSTVVPDGSRERSCFPCQHMGKVVGDHELFARVVQQEEHRACISDVARSIRAVGSPTTRMPQCSVDGGAPAVLAAGRKSTRPVVKSSRVRNRGGAGNQSLVPGGPRKRRMHESRNEPGERPRLKPTEVVLAHGGRESRSEGLTLHGARVANALGGRGREERLPLRAKHAALLATSEVLPSNAGCKGLGVTAGETAQFPRSAQASVYQTGQESLAPLACDGVRCPGRGLSNNASGGDE